MRVAGITAEYNPFHRGHEYQLQKARELTGADIVIVVMSGNFTQRGEAAIADKWIRSETAVKAGADLVIELPFLFACSRGEIFASAAVDILVAAGATHISFGCETDDFEGLSRAADLMVSEGRALGLLRSELMKEGLSYARANEQAVLRLFGEEVASCIREPNNILAVEYLKRIASYREEGRAPEPVPVKRRGSGYRDSNPSEGFAGATAIRSMEPGEMRKYLPAESMEMLEKLLPFPDREGEMFRLLRGIVMREDSNSLAGIYPVGEGFENRIIRSVREASSMDELMSLLVSGRYTASAVRRMLANILVGVRSRDADRILAEDRSAASYLRVLAAGRRGREYLKILKKRENAPPHITNVNRFTEKGTAAADLLEIDIRAADMYNLISGHDIVKSSDRVRKPYIELDK